MQRPQLVPPNRDEDVLVQLRVWIRDQGLVEIIPNEVADIVAQTIGQTERTPGGRRRR
jgi:hypothetical protein